MVGSALHLTFAIGMLSLLMWGSASAQALKGGIRGRVTVEEIGGPVPGANVEIEGGGIRVEADRDGQFFIPDLEPGRYDLLVTKQGAGLLAQRVTGIAVSGGSIAEVAPRMQAEIVELDVYQVPPEDLGGGEDLATDALALKTALPEIADVFDSKLLSKSGASDVGGALTKGAGISVVGGRYVVVRGLSDRYNVVTLNGARLPSPDPDRRAVNVDIFPNSLVENLVARKTFSPRFAGESTGGNIDIITKSIPKEGFGSVSLSLGVNTMATNRDDFLSYRGGGTGFLGNAEDRQIPLALNSFQQGDAFDSDLQASAVSGLANTLGTAFRDSALNSSFSGAVGARGEFMGRPAGVLGAVTYKKSFDYDDKAISNRATLRSDGTENIESHFEETSGTEELRAGMLLSAGVELDGGGRLGALYFGNLAVDDSAFFQRGGNDEVGGPELTDFANAFQYIVNESLLYRERTLSVFQAFGEHRLGEDDDVKVDWVASYNQASQLEPDSRITAVKANNTANRGVGIFTDLGGSEFPGNAIERIWRTVEDSSFNVQVDVEMPLFETGPERWVKLLFGGAFDATRRDFTDDSFRYANGIVVNAFRNGTLPHTFSKPASPDDAVVLTPGDVLPTNAAAATGDSRFAISRSTAPTTYFAEQNTLGFYSAFDIDLTERLNLLAGARVEIFDLKIGREFTPREIELLSAGGQSSLVNVVTESLVTANRNFSLEEIRAPVEINAVDLLPVFTWDYEISDPVRLRGAISRTAARPSFKEVAPVRTRRVPDGDVFVGNRELKTSQIANYDVRVEYTPEPGDLFAVSGFSKLINDPIELRELGSRRFFVNEVSASVYGFEIEAQKNLEDFSPFLRGVQAGFNYARIVSSVELSDASRQLRRDIGGGPTRRLQGQPDYTFNFNLTYDNQDLGLFAGLFLNVTGESVALTGGTVSGASATDIFQRPITNLNFTLEKEITDIWTLSLKAKNLTGSPSIRAYELGTLRSFDSRAVEYSVGIKGKF